MSEPAFEVIENSSDGRFELHRDGELVGFAVYSQQGDVTVVPHVETLAEHRGQGYAATLMEGLLDQLRASGRTIVPLCSFAAQHLREHPQHHDLLAARS